MQITELKIAGFKSFVDPVSVRIEPGLTGVVGPNGCGKSNILESLRWAMGATSARAMRGGEMDDLIFSGSSTRPARETAEVTMVIDNSARRAPAEFNDTDTLEILRRIKRGAGSTYKINGRTVRGKDIQLLFADASTGANSPALVRQGQISELIGSKPQNRRRILEEAAGIAGLNTRRHEAELKLKAAETNLERLSEVSAEVERQLESLKRQARKARKYKELSDRSSGLEALIAHRKWKAAEETRQAAEEALRDWRQQVEDLAIADAAAERSALAAREAIEPLRLKEVEAAGRVGQAKIELTRLENERRNSTDAVNRLKLEIQRLASDRDREAVLKSDADASLKRIEDALDRLPNLDEAAYQRREFEAVGALESLTRQREQVEVDAETAASELAAIRAERKTAEANLANLEAAFSKVAQEADRLDTQRQSLADLSTLEAALGAARNDMVRLEGEAEAASQLLQELETKAESLKETEAGLEPALNDANRLVRELEGEIAGLRRLLRRPNEPTASPVLDHCHPVAGFEKALDAALGDDLKAPTDRTAPLYWGDGATRTRPELPAGVHPLTEFTDAPDELQARLSQCGVVQDTAEGARLQAELQVGQRLVSQDGHLWRWDGFVRTPRAPATAAEILEQRNRLQAAEAELKDAIAEQTKAKAVVEAAREERTAAESALRAARRDTPRLIKAATDAKESVLRREAELERAKLVSQSVIDQIEAALLRKSEAENALQAARNAMTVQDEAPVEATLADLRNQVRDLRHQETDARDALQTLRREREALLGRKRGLERDRTDWTSRQASAAKRIEDLETAKADAEARYEIATAAPDDVTERIDTLSRKLEGYEADRKTVADTLAEADAALRQAETEAKSATKAAADAREALASSKAQLESARERLSDVSETAKTSFGRTPEGLLPLAEASLVEEDLEKSDRDLEFDLEEARRSLQALGGVNPDAEQEAEDLEARLGLQATEKEDLIAAIAKLREGVDALNAEGRERLLAAFEEVNENFKSLFSTLFNGGNAELRLTEADDPLAAGLEIFAQPPGKRLGALSLMSGGEQALTATALIFAVFLSNPAPICVLDEVDAPLDDANVDRYCRLLDEMRLRTDTRFVVITHNPVSMSRMDRLYGVTMQERGVSRLVSVDLQRAEQLVAAE